MVSPLMNMGFTSWIQSFKGRFSDLPRAGAIEFSSSNSIETKFVEAVGVKIYKKSTRQIQFNGFKPR